MRYLGSQIKTLMKINTLVINIRWFKLY